MTNVQYRKALKELGLTIVGAGPVLGVSPRTAQRMASGESEIPEPVAKLIKLAVAGKITVDDIANV